MNRYLVRDVTTTKYVVRDTSIMLWEIFCICSSESDAQEMILALTEEQLYEEWYTYTQHKFYDEPDFWVGIEQYQKRCLREGRCAFKTLFYQAIFGELAYVWDYAKVEEF